MPWYHQIGNTLKALQMHLFGKGIMTLAVLGASALSAATGIGWVLPLVAVGGVALTAVSRLYRETLYETDMVNLYRNDLAAQFGIAPEEVTRAHLKEAAKTNEVIEQALSRNRQKTYVAIATAALASTVTVFLVGAFGADSLLKNTVAGIAPQGFASLANFIGIGTVAGLSSLVFSNGLREVLKINTGYGKASSHDRIMEMEYQVAHGRGVSKEQVYGVLVAADTELQNAILHRYGKRWRHMTPQQQSNVVGEVGCAREMQAIAEQINRGDIRPGHLAYLMHESASFARPAAPQAAPEQNELPQQIGNFVERLGLAPQPQRSHREQIETQRQLAEQGASR